MPTKQIVFAIVTFLHDLFTALWIGGLLTLALSVLPASRKTLGAEATQRLLGAIQKRLSVITYISIVGLAVTGLLMSNRAPGFTGLFRFETPYATVLSLKHIAMLAMVAVAILRSLALPRMELAMPQKTKLNLGLLLLNLALGVLILLLTGFVVTLGSPLPG